MPPTSTTTRPPKRTPAPPRGYTLLESLVATALLGVIVLAVISSVNASQQVSFEGQKQVLASMCASDLMAELMTLDYQTLKATDGLSQPIGALTSLDGQAYPPAYWPLGRSAQITEEIVNQQQLGVNVRGLRVVVSATDSHGELARFETFVPEPAP